MVVKILGKGVWGSALYSVVAQNIPVITLLGKEEYSDTICFFQKQEKNYYQYGQRH